MSYYENVFIARQDISSTQVDAIADAMAAIITEDGGRVARREYWGLKALAHRMKKNKKGHYVLLNFEAKPETVREMERQMHLNEDVLRFLTLRTDDLPEEPSVVMASRADRGGRYRDRDRDRDRGRGGRPERGPAPRPEAASEAKPNDSSAKGDQA